VLISHFSFCLRYHVLSDIPSFSHGLVAAKVDKRDSMRGLPRFAAVGAGEVVAPVFVDEDVEFLFAASGAEANGSDIFVWLLGGLQTRASRISLS
jgi:hypothetical protein